MAKVRQREGFSLLSLGFAAQVKGATFVLSGGRDTFTLPHPSCCCVSAVPRRSSYFLPCPFTLPVISLPGHARIPAAQYMFILAVIES